jgi:hypothetical protein
MAVLGIPHATIHRVSGAIRLPVALAATTLACGVTPAAAQAPGQADATPPRIDAAWATSRDDLRVRFTEPLDPGSLGASDLELSMSGDPRRITRLVVAPDGVHADVRAAGPWEYGAAGAVRLIGQIADLAGNLAAAGREVRVWAGPGDTTDPRLRDVRLVRISDTRARITFRVSEDSDVVLDVRRRGSTAASTEDFPRDRGAGAIEFGPTVEGRRLSSGAYRVTIRAVDAAGNESRPVSRALVIP